MKFLYLDFELVLRRPIETTRLIGDLRNNHDTVAFLVHDHIGLQGTKVKSLKRFLPVGFSFFLIASPILAQKETFVPSIDVSFKISTEQTSYKAGQSITLKYRVKNISNAALFVPREWEATCPGSPHLWAWFEDSTGKHFVGGYAGDCSPSPQTIRERMSKEAVLLKPENTSTEHFSWTLRFSS